MIDEEATFRKFGHRSTDLIPNYRKPIVAVCDNCGKIRETTVDCYRPTCRICAQQARFAKHRVTKNCPTCQVSFTSQLSENRVYCSMKCRKSPTETINCPVCSIPFSRRIGENKTNCSKKCADRANVGKPSKKKGKTYEELYGKERAELLKEMNRVGHLGKTSNKKGKTWEEFYGEERAAEIREKIPKRMLSEKQRKESSERAKGFWKNPDYVEKHIKAWRLRRIENKPWKTKGKTFEEISPGKAKQWKKALSIAFTGKVRSPKSREKGRKITTNLWKTEDYIKKQQKARHAKINKSETALRDLLDELFSKEYKFVGDWTVAIDGRCPDFINVNGQKKIVELFGDYWHRGQNPQDRIDIFKPFGYDTLVIWEKELRDRDKLQEKLLEFHGS